VQSPQPLLVASAVIPKSRKRLLTGGNPMWDDEEREAAYWRSLQWRRELKAEHRERVASGKPTISTDDIIDLAIKLRTASVGSDWPRGY